MINTHNNTMLISSISKRAVTSTICTRGSSVGIKPNFIGEYSKEVYFYSDDVNIRNLVLNIDWVANRTNISTPYIPKGKALEIIKKSINKLALP